MEYVRLWKVSDDHIKEVPPKKLDLEERIETWLQQDISIISNDLLQIGRQVQTGFGGIDVLCLAGNGDTVIIELKRDKTPREVTSQVLDYASWVKDLSSEEIIKIANDYFEANETLEDIFSKRFEYELPETLNQSHRMVIVASKIDSATERIVRYLSGSYGVGINVLQFQILADENGQEFLARTFLMEPSESEPPNPPKRKPALTLAEWQEIADSRGVGELYKVALEKLSACFDQRSSSRSTVAFMIIKGESRFVILSLLPAESNFDTGLKFRIYKDRLTKESGKTEEEVLEMLPPDLKTVSFFQTPALDGYFKDVTSIEHFVSEFSKIKFQNSDEQQQPDD